MKSTGLIAAAAALIAAGCSGGGADGDASDAVGTPDGWVTLLDGTGFDGWTAVGDANWWLDDGAVAADQGSGHLVTETSYRDFELDLEFWVSDDANSGVFIRCSDLAQIGAETCYEINIFDQRPDPTYRTGSIVNVAPPMQTVDAGGQWNRFQIAARGPRLTVAMNGVDTVDVEDERLGEGPITLQYGAGTVKFRNVRIRPL